ncbi:LysR family transcriptional regulator [Hyphococcus formosus]|uniref:LysR family transcriptional regulator n=1 Tax=Hyphococcus formosus TaxID=3143534 RepID=UPI00398BA60E
MLNSKWLETFTVLCETAHFTRAASRLNMTQPGVSQHLRNLEEQVGQPLITKQGKSFTLTPAGEAVFAVGQKRRKEEDGLFELITEDDPHSGEVVIASSGSFAMLLYPALIKAMQKAPHLVLKLEATPQNKIIEGVIGGDFDLGIVSQEPSNPRIEGNFLGREELCLVAPAGTAREKITLAALDRLGFIAHPDGFTYADELFLKNFPTSYAGSESLRVRAYINQISQIPSPVAEGIGYTLLPRSGVDSFPNRDKLEVLPLEHSCHHDLWLIQKLGRQMPRRADNVANLIRSVSKGLGS